MNRNSSKQLVNQIPKKWLAIGVLALILYACLQPIANSQLGWSLPSLASLIGDNSQPAPVENTSSSTQQGTASSKKQTQSSQKQSGRTQNSEAAKDDMSFGFLRAEANEVYVSPAGLRYTKGSEEGHRLLHLSRHLKDQPNRNGPHGVFDGDMTVVLGLLDQVYVDANKGAKGTSKKNEGSRDRLEKRFAKPVGFVGGQTGKRKNNPPANSIRLIIQGKNVITAFPF